MTIGEKLRELRIRAGMSQRKMAETLGWYQPRVYCYECKATPTLSVLLEIVRALGASLAEFDDCEIPNDGRCNNKGRFKKKKLAKV